MLKLQSPTQNICATVQDSPKITNPAVEDSVVLEGFLRREELAQQLGLSPRTIDRWHALRNGPPRVCLGRTILYRVESVREWLRSREQQLSPPKRPRRLPMKRNVTERENGAADGCTSAEL